MAEKNDTTLSGYVMEADDGALVYHLSRYPRRAFGEPPSDAVLSKLAEELKVDLESNHGGKVTLTYETESLAKIRSILGLEEG